MRLLFIIPFVSKRYAHDYPRASAMLSSTIRSIRRQTVQDFGVMLVSNDAPDIDMSDVIFVQTDLEIDDPSRYGRRQVDKERKIHWGLVEARKYDPSYVMLFDADDLVSCRLVEFVEKHNSYDGFILRRGYIHEIGSNRLRRSFRFHRSCGSNYVFRFDKKLLPHKHTDYQTSDYRQWWPIKGHNKDPASDFQNLGYRFKYIPFFAAIYRQWSNNETRAMKNSTKSNGVLELSGRLGRRVLERKITPPIAEEFGIHFIVNDSTTDNLGSL